MGLSSDARRNSGVIPRHDAESRDTGKGEYPQATRFQAPLQAGMTECGLTCPDYPLTIFYYPRPPQNERKKQKHPAEDYLPGVSCRAEDEAQTRDPQLGRLMLYQLSYFRNLVWAKMDSNHRRRKPADLQSAPFGHSGICPKSVCKDNTLYFNLQTKSCIFIAATAASSPLLPNRPPARSRACSMVSVVSTPKIKGIPKRVLRWVMPCVTLWHT